MSAFCTNLATKVFEIDEMDNWVTNVGRLSIELQKVIREPT